MQVRNVFKTVVNTRYVYQGNNLEDAIRAWDGETYQTGGLGGVMIQSFMADIMVRDGWVLHVRINDSGEQVTYLNPSLTLP